MAKKLSRGKKASLNRYAWLSVEDLQRWADELDRHQSRLSEHIATIRELGLDELRTDGATKIFRAVAEIGQFNSKLLYAIEQFRNRTGDTFAKYGK